MIWNDEKFYSSFAAVGSTLGADRTSSEYIDLEELFINFLFRISDDDRVNRSILFWLTSYGKYLSPRKIKRKLNGLEFEPAVLGVLLTFCDSRFPRGDFSSLDSMVESTDNETLFFRKLSKRVPRDPTFEKFGILFPLVSCSDKERSHWIKAKKWVLKNAPEVRNRVSGFVKSIADYRSLIEREGDKSIYYVQKRIGVTYARAHKIYHENILPTL